MRRYLVKKKTKKLVCFPPNISGSKGINYAVLSTRCDHGGGTLARAGINMAKGIVRAAMDISDPIANLWNVDFEREKLGITCVANGVICVVAD